MRVGLLFFLASIHWLGTVWADPPRQRGRGGAVVVIPVEPHEHDRLQWFGRKDHHLVPGTVTINQAPYVCDAHDRAYEERDTFLAHLRSAHGMTPADIPNALVVENGVVHFIGVDSP